MRLKSVRVELVNAVKKVGLNFSIKINLNRPTAVGAQWENNRLFARSWWVQIQPQEGPGPNVIKLFYGRNLRIFVINYIVCPWQAFPA